MREYKILSVDDDPGLLAVVTSALEDRGYWVTAVLGGEAALDTLRMKEFDLVISDLNMPGADGMAVLKTAKEIQPHCGVIILSGNVDTMTATMALEGGADEYMRKPFGIDDLWNTVDYCLKKKALERETKRGQTESPQGLKISLNEETALFAGGPSFACS